MSLEFTCRAVEYGKTVQVWAKKPGEHDALRPILELSPTEAKNLRAALDRCGELREPVPAEPLPVSGVEAGRRVDNVLSILNAYKEGYENGAPHRRSGIVLMNPNKKHTPEWVAWNYGFHATKPLTASEKTPSSAKIAIQKNYWLGQRFFRPHPGVISAPAEKSAQQQESMYFVWCPTVGAPTKPHETIETARAEARRLCLLPKNKGRQYFVLRAIESVQQAADPIITRNYSRKG